ncbi:MAG: hypothetical protein QXP70_04050 [Methanomassiliicoccales archaeon]
MMRLLYAREEASMLDPLPLLLRMVVDAEVRLASTPEECRLAAVLDVDRTVICDFTKPDDSLAFLNSAMKRLESRVIVTLPSEMRVLRERIESMGAEALVYENDSEKITSVLKAVSTSAP